VSIDYTTLLGLTPGIQVAQADYDFTRDGGGQGSRVISTEVVPSGSIVLGYAVYTTAAVVQASGGQVYLAVGQTDLALVDPALDHNIASWRSGAAAVVANADRPLTVSIYTHDVTAGGFTAWVFYLPT
jgi:hypothetical protein